MSARQEARERRDARAARAATLAAAEASAAAHAVSGAAEQAREELEGEVWRVLGVYSKHPLVHLVDGILTRADAHAEAVAAQRVAEALDDRARQRRLASAEASAAEHRERLGQATS